jgi:hypothetical protein
METSTAAVRFAMYMAASAKGRPAAVKTSREDPITVFVAAVATTSAMARPQGSAIHRDVARITSLTRRQSNPPEPGSRFRRM